jgi:hypothetical protein
MLHDRNKRRVMSPDLAEEIAANALAFIASDPRRLGRFMSLSGLTPDVLRSEAASRRVLAAVLAHLAEDESLLLVFAHTAAVAPESIAPARDLLADAASRE